ncbi:SRPBCC family protein [Actinocrispum wychmicini]|uniref:SRPBCC family protein n=1 Tax=Actinocrispum wychmicini TaxID=1213861 RepID=UPI0014055AB1|nr:SRPBCC family protein [Actinocrispum wychmicini]
MTTSRRFATSPEDMWKRIGGFGSLHEWHPAVTSTAVTASGQGRELVTTDGGRIVETLLDNGPSHYSYRIDQSALPFATLVSTLRVLSDLGGCVVEWDAEFEPLGVSATDAANSARQFLQTGLDALQ